MDKSKLTDAINSAAESVSGRKVDPAILKKLRELRRKQAAGKLDLRDLKTFFELYRDTIIPLAKRQQIERLHALKDMIPDNG
jgi:hypothetical protein